MTRLFVLRHAKAVSALPGMRDFDRPLEDIGRVAARALGAVLSEKGHIPEEIICSPSLRTRQTLEGVAEYFSKPVPTSFDEELFTEEWSGYLEFIQNTKSQSSLMIVGHNPSCEDIVHQLVGSGDKQALRRLLDGFAPGTLAVIDFQVPFGEIGPRSGYLESLLLDGCAKR
jgi:phosphohistidine phosphatase